MEWVEWSWLVTLVGGVVVVGDVGGGVGGVGGGVGERRRSKSVCDVSQWLVDVGVVV